MRNKRLYNKEKSTSSLVKACLAEERWAQEELYNLYSPKMYAVCMRYAKDINEAQEFLQTGFIKVFVNLNKFGDKGSLEGWIRSVLVRNTLDTIKKNTKIREVELEDHPSDLIIAEDEISKYENLSEELILSEIQKLETKQQLIFNLFHLEEMSHKEISTELNILESTSRSILRRAKKNLKEQLERYL